MLVFKEVVLSKVDIDYKDIFVRSKSTDNIVGGIKLEANTLGHEFYSISIGSLTYPNLPSVIDSMSGRYKFYDCKTNQEITVHSFNTDTIAVDDIDYTKGVISIEDEVIQNLFSSINGYYYRDSEEYGILEITNFVVDQLKAGYKVYQLV